MPPRSWPLVIQVVRNSLFLDGSKETLHVDGLRALDGEAKGTGPDELGEGSDGTADTEGDGVVQGLLEAEVVEEHARCSIDIRVRVLGL